MMKNKVPRKLKKELRKVDCLETSRPSIKMKKNPFSPYKMMFTQQRVKLKEGVKMNKWTKRLVRNILREVRRNHKRNMELAMKRQIDWIHNGINPMNSYTNYSIKDIPISTETIHVNIPEHKDFEIINSFANKMLTEATPIDEEIQNVINDHFWDML